MMNQFWNVNEKEKYQLAQNTLDPLEQILYSSLIGIRALEQEAQSESAKEFLVTLKKEIERQLKELKKASISVYPICMQDLGPMGAVKSLVEIFKEDNILSMDIEFKGLLKRQPHKIEIQLFRFIQYLIRMIGNLKTVTSLDISVVEKEGQIDVTFDAETIVEQLKHSAEYELFKELIDSMSDVEIVERNDCQIILIYFK